MIVSFFALTECNNMLNLLLVYEELSGKKVNRDKTAIFFSKSMTEATRQIVKGILGVREIHL